MVGTELALKEATHTPLTGHAGLVSAAPVPLKKAISPPVM